MLQGKGNLERSFGLSERHPADDIVLSLARQVQLSSDSKHVQIVPSQNLPSTQKSEQGAGKGMAVGTVRGMTG